MPVWLSTRNVERKKECAMFNLCRSFLGQEKRQ